MCNNKSTFVRHKTIMNKIICLTSLLLLSSFGSVGHANENTSNADTQLNPKVNEDNIRVANHGGVTYSLHGCAKTGGSVTCSFLLISEKDTGAYISTSSGYSSTKFIDFEGNEYSVNDARIGSKTVHGSSVKNNLLKGIPLKASVSFNNVPDSINKMAILYIELGSGSIRFDNVPLSINSTDRLADLYQEANDHSTSQKKNRSIVDEINTVRQTTETVKDIIKIF